MKPTCCYLDDLTPSCPRPAAYAIWNKAGHETYACAEHQPAMTDPGDAVWKLAPGAAKEAKA